MQKAGFLTTRLTCTIKANSNKSADEQPDLQLALNELSQYLMIMFHFSHNFLACPNFPGTTVNSLNFRTLENFAVIYLNSNKRPKPNRVFHQKDVNEIEGAV